VPGGTGGDMTGAVFSSGLIKRIAAVWVLVCSAIFYLWSIANPNAEWDMLLYAASAELLNDAPYSEVHEKVYSNLERRLSAEEFSAISGGDHYRTVMYEDAQAFMEQLPYYRIRVTFNSLLALASSQGFDVYAAGHFISATAIVLCFLLLWFTFRNHIHPLIQMVLPIVFYKYTRELEVMGQILADSLASLWVVFICIAYTRRSALLLLLIGVSVLVRVDLFIFAVLMLLLLLYTERVRRWPPILLTGGVVICIFLAIQQWADSYGWKSLYYFAILSEMTATHPSVYQGLSFTLAEYFHSLVFPPRWVSKMYVVTALCSLATVLLPRWYPLTSDLQRRVCEISGICLLYIAGHYLIFPQMYLRFFVAQNMVVFTAFSIVLTQVIRSLVAAPADLKRLSVLAQGKRLHD
jgi:hypothetical protein